MAGAQLSQLAMITTDVALVGRLGKDEALASMAVGQAAYGLLLSFGIGLIAAVSPLASQAFGAGRRAEAERALGMGLYCAALFGLLANIILWPIDHLFSRLGYQAHVIYEATGYVHYLALGLPAFLVFLALKNYLDATSRPRLAFIVAFLAIAINFALDYGLIFGRLGLPAWGMLGAAVATTSVNYLMALSLIAFVLRELGPRYWIPDQSELKSFSAIGLPSAMALLMEVGLFASSAFLMGMLGTDEAAAHQIVMTCASTTFMVPLGISFAGATRVGQKIGAQKYDEVQAAGLAAMAVGIIAMLLSGLLFATIPEVIVSFFWNPSQGGEKVRSFAVDLLLIAAAFQIFDATQVTANSALRAMKDVRIPLALAFSSYWVIGLSLSVYLAFYTPLRHRGIWIGLSAGLCCAALSLAYRFVFLAHKLTTKHSGKVQHDE